MADKDTGVNSSVEDTLKQAIEADSKDDSSSATTEESKVSTQKGDDTTETQDKKNPVPYERFSEVIGERNDAKEKVSDLEEQLQTYQDTVTERDDLLNRIRGLAADERVSQHVFAIDKALKGDFSDLEKQDDTTSTETDQELSDDEVNVKKLLSEQKGELEDALALQRAEQLYSMAQDRATRYLEALPEEYTEEDRDVLAEMWNNRVDWDAIEEDTGVLDNELARSFEETLVKYGEPRGMQKQTQDTETQTTVTQEPTQEEKVAQLLDVDYSKLDKEGKPEVSDDEFAKQLAKSIRLGRE